MKRVLAILFALFALAAPLAAAESENLADPAQETRARALQKELRCLVCQGQSLDDSDAELARDLRGLIREHIRAGESDEAVKQFLMARYGAFVLLKPPLESDTYALWFAPVLVLAIGAGVVAITIARTRRRADGSEAGPAAD